MVQQFCAHTNRGLTEEQIQKAFEEIRVEQHDMHPGSMAPKPAVSTAASTAVPGQVVPSVGKVAIIAVCILKTQLGLNNR
eukprot:2496321-Amphidinium_carterae.1